MATKQRRSKEWKLMGLTRYLPSASAVSKTLVLAAILRSVTIGLDRASKVELAEEQMYTLLANTIEAIGALVSPVQREWFMAQVTELKSQKLSSETYVERLVELLGKAAHPQQDDYNLLGLDPDQDNNNNSYLNVQPPDNF
jgi:hypothetical protein